MENGAATKKKMSFVEQVRGMPANFWYANLMEILERLAFFGVRAVAPLYLVAASEQNGLGLRFDQKGLIYGIWALLQCLIPMVSGGYTDRYGYRKSLVVAFVLNIIGYIGMAQSKPIADHLIAQGWEGAGFWVFMAAACFVATGTAIFKPPCHGTIAKAVDEETSSMGWGLFYWVVNIGGAFAPILAAPLRGEINWHIVFYAAAIVTACNFLPCFLLYKEPEKVPPKEDEQQKGPIGVFLSSIATIFKDLRLVVFLGIFSCFWLMFMQLWDLLPNFVDEWVDTSDVAPYFGGIWSGWVLASGQTKPEMIIAINPWSIILLVLVVSWVIRRLHKVAAMVIGMLISLVGFVSCGMTMVGVFVCIMILIFSIGEMACSPTFSAYVGLIAPKDKKALYMGYSNIPFAIGWAIGNGLGGVMYEAMSSKFKLARQYLVDKLGMNPDFAMNDEILPNTQVMETVAHLSETGDADLVEAGVRESWQVVNWESLTSDQTIEKINEIYASVLGQVDAAALQQATQTLWDLHHPYMVWLYLGAFGLAGTIGMIIFYFVSARGRSQTGEQEAEETETTTA